MRVSLLLMLLAVLATRCGPEFQLPSGNLTEWGKCKRSYCLNGECVEGDSVEGEAEELIDLYKLHMSLAFDNVQGGKWTQGWKIVFPTEREQRSKAFLVAFSHNDPGWLMPFEEYYQRKTKAILDSVTNFLTNDASLRFIWTETSFFSRWWKDCDDAKKAQFFDLLEKGQIEFAGGGWVMNDEAASHYPSIINQYTEGHEWLRANIGDYFPKYAWAIDPFGHSSTQAYFHKRIGFKAMYIQRIHYETKKWFASHQALEFFW